ncbi:hypothetical protein chiPu_0029977, partial [Chiloscyllium punctatum]|nr:hypothetical protein [Chiloscyllium punctatum]
MFVGGGCVLTLSVSVRGLPSDAVFLQLLSGIAVPFRLPHDHPLFTHIADTVTEGFLSRSAHWRPFAEAAVALTYQLSEKPDRLCGALLVRCAHLLSRGHPESRTEEKGAGSE